jgi:hypothetical protein
MPRIIGLVASAMLPRTTYLLTNPQVTGRPSPTLVDMNGAATLSQPQWLNPGRG